MSKKNQTRLIAFMLCLGVGLLCVWVIRSYKLEVKSWQAQVKQYQHINRELQVSQYYNWSMEGVQIPEMTVSREDLKVSLSDKLKDKNLLVYIDYRMCNPCVESNLELIQALARTHPQHTRVLVYTPGGKISTGIDFSVINDFLFTTPESLDIDNIQFVI